MFYKFKENGELENSSNVNIDGSYIELNFTDEELDKLNKGYLYNDGKFIESNKSILNEKLAIIYEIKDLGRQGEELRSKYLSAELLPDSELKTETLRILKEKGDLVMTQYIEKQHILIEKYGIEILQEIL